MLPEETRFRFVDKEGVMVERFCRAFAHRTPDDAAVEGTLGNTDPSLARITDCSHASSPVASGRTMVPPASQDAAKRGVHRQTRSRTAKSEGVR